MKHDGVQQKSQLQVKKEAEWLFQHHDPETFLRWLGVLRYTCFWRASGGHGTDADELVIVLVYDGAADLEQVCHRLGLPEGMSVGESAKAQVPGVSLFCTRAEQEIWCFFGDGTSWEVEEGDVRQAQVFERLLDRWGWPERVSAAGVEHPGCVTEERVRELLPWYHPRERTIVGARRLPERWPVRLFEGVRDMGFVVVLVCVLAVFLSPILAVGGWLWADPALGIGVFFLVMILGGWIAALLSFFGWQRGAAIFQTPVAYGLLAVGSAGGLASAWVGYQVVVLHPGEYAFGRRRDGTHWLLERPGRYLLSPTMFIDFLGTKEDDEAVDPLSL